MLIVYIEELCWRVSLQIKVNSVLYFIELPSFLFLCILFLVFLCILFLVLYLVSECGLILLQYLVTNFASDVVFLNGYFFLIYTTLSL